MPSPPLDEGREGRALLGSHAPPPKELESKFAARGCALHRHIHTYTHAPFARCVPPHPRRTRTPGPRGAPPRLAEAVQLDGGGQHGELRHVHLLGHRPEVLRGLGAGAALPRRLGDLRRSGARNSATQLAPAIRIREAELCCSTSAHERVSLAVGRCTSDGRPKSPPVSANVGGRIGPTVARGQSKTGSSVARIGNSLQDVDDGARQWPARSSISWPMFTSMFSSAVRPTWKVPARSGASGGDRSAAQYGAGQIQRHLEPDPERPRALAPSPPPLFASRDVRENPLIRFRARPPNRCIPESARLWPTSSDCVPTSGRLRGKLSEIGPAPVEIPHLSSPRQAWPACGQRCSKSRQVRRDCTKSFDSRTCSPKFVTKCVGSWPKTRRPKPFG